MPPFQKCPCCNDNEHEYVQTHEIMVVQVPETTGVLNYIAQYYYCPITQEIYEDEELQREHMRFIEESLKENVNEEECKE